MIAGGRGAPSGPRRGGKRRVGRQGAPLACKRRPAAPSGSNRSLAAPYAGPGRQRAVRARDPAYRLRGARNGALGSGENNGLDRRRDGGLLHRVGRVGVQRHARAGAPLDRRPGLPAGTPRGRPRRHPEPARSGWKKPTAPRPSRPDGGHWMPLRPQVLVVDELPRSVVPGDVPPAVRHAGGRRPLFPGRVHKDGAARRPDKLRAGRKLGIASLRRPACPSGATLFLRHDPSGPGAIKTDTVRGRRPAACGIALSARGPRRRGLIRRIPGAVFPDETVRRRGAGRGPLGTGRGCAQKAG